ncbi:MAG: DUF2304 domain-containing protein [Bacteroidetes bacterium]|nr:MAG: DUF2304 domain-containing protein [Bacteroidota bacterium]
MEQDISYRIQIISIVVSLIFLFYVSRLIVKGKLREEYAIFWVIGTVLLIIFSFWRKGLDIFAELVGVYSPPNLVFTAAIFAVFIYLIHLSVVVSKLHDKNKTMAQELALTKAELKEQSKDKKIKESDD